MALTLLSLSGAGHSIAQANNLNSQTTTSSSSLAGLGLFLIIYIVVLAILIVSAWKIYTKAGKPGWASIIPFYNYYVLLQIVGRPTWWIILLFVPIVNIIIVVIVSLDLAKAFGKGIGFGLLNIFLPFISLPILAFGNAQYVGINGAGSGDSPTAPQFPVAPNGNTPVAPTPTPPFNDPPVVPPAPTPGI